MLSIFVMYSTDRSEALGHTISCLEDMPLYQESQKTLVVDGKIDHVPKDWEVVQVPRNKGKFCWGRMWDAGVCSARNQNVLYLDSDRLLPKNLLESVVQNVTDSVFLYTSHHFMMMDKLTIQDCRRILESDNPLGVIGEDFVGKVRYEKRHGVPMQESGKNVMSGSTAFTRDTYFRIGGVDHWYCGHGAFADSDFHMQAAQAGCTFLDLRLTELHYPHEKQEEGSCVSKEVLYLRSLDNFIYYCNKWGFPVNLAESMAERSGIPVSHVTAKFKECAS